MPKKTVIDVDGSNAVSRVLMDLLNTFPGLDKKQKIEFATLPETSAGIGFFPTMGAIYEKNNEDITGHVKQVCAYPAQVVYRTSVRTEEQRMRVKEFLDALGRWLERQPVTLVLPPFVPFTHPGTGIRVTALDPADARIDI